MKKHYDFSKAKKSPYAKRLKRTVTINLDDSTVEDFKALAEEKALPFQTLINLLNRPEDQVSTGGEQNLRQTLHRTRHLRCSVHQAGQVRPALSP